MRVRQLLRKEPWYNRMPGWVYLAVWIIGILSVANYFGIVLE